ncbi:hypothetical protein SAMN06265355_101369 [Actinomadura mexicana]|uniref:Uncharacterized protein n=1 Tax=Actinomadura mexicana TaxID=134959 RepID=A0A238UTA8_9ACTN|nr:hypothetical protein SAMN06265355_101369 [Actinomadura mexicana]
MSTGALPDEPSPADPDHDQTKSALTSMPATTEPPSLTGLPATTAATAATGPSAQSCICGPNSIRRTGGATGRQARRDQCGLGRLRLRGAVWS